MVEDNLADVRLTREALAEYKLRNELAVVTDGEAALRYLRQEDEYADASIPDVILLDLNLPKKDGREVLEEVKADPALRHIPVVVLTTSEEEADILESYRLQAACYITKPVEIDRFMEVVKRIDEFWFSVVKLPPRDRP